MMFVRNVIAGLVSVSPAEGVVGLDLGLGVSFVFTVAKVTARDTRWQVA
jgi:hypothetical protein